MPAAALASAGIETVQAMALPLRYGTVRDVISNTLGALLGYLLAHGGRGRICTGGPGVPGPRRRRPRCCG